MIDYDKIEYVYGKTAQLEVLVHMLNVKEDYLSGIAKATGLSHSSVCRVMLPLIDMEMITERRIGKQLRMFTLNEKSEIVRNSALLFDAISKWA